MHLPHAKPSEGVDARIERIPGRALFYLAVSLSVFGFGCFLGFTIGGLTSHRCEFSYVARDKDIADVIDAPEVKVISSIEHEAQFLPDVSRSTESATAEAEIKVEEPKASGGLPHRLNALSLTATAPKRFVAPRVCVVQSDNRWAPAPAGPKDVQTSVRLAVAYADKVGAKYILYNANAQGAGKPVAIDSACRTGECDVVFYIDTDAFVEEFNDDVYKELSFLFDEGAIVVAGQDYLATIRANNKDLNYLADFNAGEIIVNCNARKYADFIANWKVLAHHEKEDQVALGMLQRQHRFKNAIQWDARFIGVYGRFTRHFPGKTKPQMKAYVDARAGEAPFWDGAARKIDPQAAREIEGRTIVRRSSWFRMRKR